MKRSRLWTEWILSIWPSSCCYLDIYIYIYFLVSGRVDPCLRHNAEQARGPLVQYDFKSTSSRCCISQHATVPDLISCSAGSAWCLDQLGAWIITGWMEQHHVLGWVDHPKHQVYSWTDLSWTERVMQRRSGDDSPASCGTFVRAGCCMVTKTEGTESSELGQYCAVTRS